MKKEYFVRKALLSFTVAVALSGCMSTTNELATLEKANERAHNVSLFHICKGYQLGIPPADYRGSEQLVAAWAILCQDYYDRKLTQANEVQNE